ncbi:PKD-like family lipoprotein [Bacteroides bouchesdurhonensis]
MKYKILLLLPFLGCCLASCYEDKGNYDYNDLLQVSGVTFVRDVDGEETESSSWEVPVGTVLKIRPILSFTKEKGKTNLAYTWIYKDEVIGQEEQLNWLTEEVGGGYVQLDIEDLDTENHFLFNFSVNITDPYRDSGFLILNEKDGIPYFNFIRGSYYGNDVDTEYEPLLGLYQKENGETLKPEAEYFKIHEHFRKDNNYPSYNTQFMIVGKHELMDVNAYTFKEVVRGSENMFMAGMPEISDVMFMQWFDIVTDQEGKVYRRKKSTNELYHSNQFLAAPMKDDKGQELSGIKIIPGDLSDNFCLLFDQKRNCFLTISDWKDSYYGDNNLGQISVLESGSGEWPENFVPLDNLGDYKMIFCGFYRDAWGSIKRYFTILKKDNRYYYQQFSVDSDYNTGIFYVDNCVRGELTGFTDNMADGIMSLMWYSNGFDSSMHPYLFIAKENKLYLYDYTAINDSKEKVQEMYTFDSPIVAVDGTCISGVHLGVGLADGTFHAIKATNAKYYLNDPSLILWTQKNLGEIKCIKYNTSAQAPSYY